MPSKADLAKEAQDLAKELGIEITTEGLNHASLVSLVSDLKAKKKDADNPAAENAQAEAEAEEVVELPPYSVAKGKAITTKRGIRAEGDEVFASDFVGGQKILDGFVKTRHIVKA